MKFNSISTLTAEELILIQTQAENWRLLCKVVREEGPRVLRYVAETDEFRCAEYCPGDGI